jgi:hypothetical protein
MRKVTMAFLNLRSTLSRGGEVAVVKVKIEVCARGFIRI